MAVCDSYVNFLISTGLHESSETAGVFRLQIITCDEATILKVDIEVPIQIALAGFESMTAAVAEAIRHKTAR